MRQAWWRKVRRIDVNCLVFVDESGANTALTRTRARAPKGERAVGSVPQGEWKTVTMLGALRLRGIAAAATIAATTDGDVFRTFVREALVPVLGPGGDLQAIRRLRNEGRSHREIAAELKLSKGTVQRVLVAL